MRCGQAGVPLRGPAPPGQAGSASHSPSLGKENGHTALSVLKQSHERWEMLVQTDDACSSSVRDELVLNHVAGLHQLLTVGHVARMKRGRNCWLRPGLALLRSPPRKGRTHGGLPPGPSTAPF